MDLDDEPAQPRRITEPGIDAVSGPRLEADQVVGRYIIQNFLAQGGMGVVYVARDPELGRRVALKLVRTPGGADGTMRQRLLREAQALAQLSHPNVIAVYDVGTHDDGVFIAMELIDGVSLRTFFSQPRTWRAKVDVLIAAGRGLAAAHAAGIVHRDFKPENVIIGNDGRVCVLDFGLARAAGDHVPTEPGRRAAAVATSPEPPEAQDQVATVTIAPSDHALSRERLEAHLTGFGTVVGTPPYMAPEHHRGEAVTAASDQFSFCVTAWEALYGARPFSGQAEALRTAKEEHRVHAPPRGTRVPARVRRLLQRGLAPQPGDRHESMSELLSALIDALAAPRRRAVAVAVVLVGVGVAVAFWWRSPAQQLCSLPNAERSLGEALPTGLAAQLEGSFRKTGRASASETSRRVAGVLDAYRAEWTDMYLASCRATHERGEQSEALLDRRTNCLAGRREALRALVGQLVRAGDGEVVDRAVQAALALPAVASCADVMALGAAAPLPVRPAAREALATQQRALAEVRALVETGQYAAAAPGARAVTAASRTLGYAPLLAEALHTLSSVEDDLGELEAAMRAASEGALAAGAARDDALLAQALLDVMWVYDRQAKYEHALVLSPAIEATLARGELAVGPGAAAGQALEDKRATYLSTRGRVLTDQGAYAEAALAFERALAIRERLHGPEHWRLAAVLNSLGEVLRSTGRYDEALVRYASARTITERALGREHPNVGAIVNNIGTVYERLSRYDEAKAMYEESLRIDEATFGPEHPRVAISLLNLGSMLVARGQAETAVPMYQRALAIQRRVVGPSHPDVAMVLHNLGLAELSLGQPELALTRFREALEMMRAALPADHVSVSLPLLGIGDALFEDNRPVEAAEHYERALAIQSAVYGSDSLDLAYALQGLAQANLAAGRVSAALAAAERLVAAYAKERGDPDDQALAEFMLAKCMWAAGRDRPRALERARAARQVIATSKDRDLPALRKELRTLDAWLAQRRR